MLAACSASKPPETQLIVLPSGSSVKAIGYGPIDGAPVATMGLRYETSFNAKDKDDITAEAVRIFHFFRFQAEGHDDKAAIVTAQPVDGGDSVDVRFAKIDGVWRQVDADGKAIDSLPPTLHGTAAALQWMTGVWNCTYRSVADKFAKGHPTVVIDEPNATGSGIDQTFSEVVAPSLTNLGETAIGYDAARKVWFQHGHEVSQTGAPNPPSTNESIETPAAYSRDMTFTGAAHPSEGPAITVRMRDVVDGPRTSSHAVTQALLGGVWTTVAKDDCSVKRG